MLLNYDQVFWIYNASLPKPKAKVAAKTLARRKKILSVFKGESFNTNLIYKRFKCSYSTAKVDILAMQESGELLDLGDGWVKRALGVCNG